MRNQFIRPMDEHGAAVAQPTLNPPRPRNRKTTEDENENEEENLRSLRKF